MTYVRVVSQPLYTRVLNRRDDDRRPYLTVVVHHNGSPLSTKALSTNRLNLTLLQHHGKPSEHTVLHDTEMSAN